MGSRFLPWTSAVCLVLLSVSADIAKGNCKDFDFEKGAETLSKWTKTGDAFDNQPTYGDNAHIRDSKINTNVQGDWWIGTFENRSKPDADAGYLTGDYPIGTLTSPKFRITGSKLSFLFGGGCDAGQIRVELLVNGQVAREASADDCRERMRRREWDVGQFKNKIAQIRLVDASRKGHVNFDDLWGDFTCIGNETTNFDSHNATSSVKYDKEDNLGDHGELLILDEPLAAVNPNTSKSHENSLTGTDDEYDAVQNSPKPHAPLQNTSVQKGNEKEDVADQIAETPHLDLPNRPLKVSKAPSQHDNLLGETKISSSNIKKGPKQPLLPKAVSFAKIVKASPNKLRDNSSNNSLPGKDDDIRNLTCKSFLVKIKTGKPWDNDFLFSSNGNYQSTRREIEVKVLDAYEDDKDFRGAFFTKFSSSEEPGEVKAFFVLRFRAVGKFLGKLIDAFGAGNVSAAGCFDTSAITQCPSPCPHTCAPLCQSSCCQPQAPQPVAQCPSPCPQACAPSCQSSCCQQQVPAPVAQCPSPCPQSCAPSCQSSCCQQYASAPVAPLPLYQPAVPMPSPSLQPMQIAAQPWYPQPLSRVYATRPPPPQGLPGSQCSAGCSPNCAPSCSPTCCQFYNASQRKGEVKNWLRKQNLQEERR